MNSIDRMLHEYVYPFIILTLIGGAIALCFGSAIGEAIDKDYEFQESIYQQHGRAK